MRASSPNHAQAEAEARHAAVVHLLWTVVLFVHLDLAVIVAMVHRFFAEQLVLIRCAEHHAAVHLSRRGSRWKVKG